MHQNRFVLPDKSFWKALDHEQQKVLSSRYTILFPPILFTEIAKNGLSPCNPSLVDLELENLIVVPHWSEEAKKDLLTEESDKPIFFGRASTMESILESPEQELLEFKEASDEYIEMQIEIEEFYRNLSSIIDSDEEWVNEAYNADSLESANQLAARLFDHDPSDHYAAHEIVQRLCGLFDSILTENERTQIFNRFLEEGMPSIRRFAPYTLGAVVWNYTIQLLLRENSENAAPIGVLRDAEYLLYMYYKNISFVSGDKWHRKFVNEVPLFEGIRENFLFVDLTTKATIQEGFLKLL